MTNVHQLAHTIARPVTGNPGSGGVSSGPWFWLGLAFMIVVGTFVAFRAVARRR